MLFKSLLAVTALAAAHAKQYTKFDNAECSGYKDPNIAAWKWAGPLPGTKLPSMKVEDCQVLCEKNSTCVSFVIRVGKLTGYSWCSASSRCAPAKGITLQARSPDDVNYKYTTYVLTDMATFKLEAPKGYTMVKDAGCYGHDDGNVFARTHTPAECAAECTKDATCISYEWRWKYNYCYLSSTCSRANGIEYYAKYTDRHLFVDSTKNTYPTAVPVGYELQTDMHCTYRDDKSITTYTDTLATCAAHCTKSDKCVSFEWTGRTGYPKCYLSNTCAPSKGVAPTARSNWDLYTKTKETVAYTAVPAGFTVQKDRHCYVRNNLKEDRSRAMTIGGCAAECAANQECVSFEWTHRAGSNFCHLSRSCAPAFGVLASRSSSYLKEDLYIKTQYMVYPSEAPAGFKVYKDRYCSARDDTAKTAHTETIASCAKLCEDDAKCVSFEWTGRSEGYASCYTSTSCAPAHGVTPSIYYERDLYIKTAYTKYADVVPTGYTLHKHTACSGRHVGAAERYSTLTECSNKCNNHANCVSFQWDGRRFNGGTCWISETCAKGKGVYPNENHAMYDLYVQTIHDTYPTAVPAGFTLKEDHYCNGYDGTTTSRSDTLNSCAKKCGMDATCVSFEWDRRMGVGGTCRMSAECAPSKGVVSTVYAGVSLYIKTSQVAYIGTVDGFQRNENRVCHGHNDAGTYSRSDTLASCAARCVAKGNGCVSFEWSGRKGTNTCWLSKTCSAKLGTQYSTYDETDLYVKHAFAGAASIASKYYTVSAFVPAGFKLQQDRICHYRDAGITDSTGKAIASANNGVESLAGCAQKCRDAGSDCVSFEWSGRSVSHTYCWLSKTCAPAFGLRPTDSSGRDVYIKAEYSTYPTVAPAGYTRQTDSSCGHRRRELGTFHYTETIQSCAAKCDAIKECVSYEWNGRRHGSSCYLSSSCAPSQGIMVNENAFGYDVYVKSPLMTYTSIVPTGFNLEKDRWCYKRDRTHASYDERYSHSLPSCAAKCRANSTCVSFEWDGRIPGRGRCDTSGTCAPSHGVLPTHANMVDLYIKATETTYVVVTPHGYTLLKDTYCHGTNRINKKGSSSPYHYTETVDTCSKLCDADADCVSFVWKGRNAATHATCVLTKNCASAMSAIYTKSMRTDLFIKNAYAGTAFPTGAPTMRPTHGAKECVAVTRPLGWTVPTSCDTIHCREWDCKEWCKCYTHDDDAVYKRNGCDTDDGKPCNCAALE